MTAVATGILVDGPIPRPPDYTLVGASTVVEMGEDEHYLMGLAVRSYPAGVPVGWDWINHLTSAGGSDKTAATITSFQSPEFRGFSVLLREQCNARGLGAQLFAERVTAIFAAVEAYAVEREFATGELMPDSVNLADAIPVPGGADATLFPSGSTAQKRMEGLAQLEACIASTGRKGMIHTTPSLATMWANDHALNQVTIAGQKVLVTILGTPVVPGYGYQLALAATPSINSSTPVPPAGHTAPTGTQEWAYATGPVEIRRSPLETIPEATEEALGQAIDRAQNLLAYEAVRHYVYDWDATFKAAVKIDRAT